MVLKISLPAQRRHWMNGLFSKIEAVNATYKYANA
jgi:hypothetical protein